jgi:S-DNA-T family DNA segregation ATPase FtsK/SpoIIIE
MGEPSVEITVVRGTEVVDLVVVEPAAVTLGEIVRRLGWPPPGAIAVDGRAVAAGVPLDVAGVMAGALVVVDGPPPPRPAVPGQAAPAVLVATVAGPDCGRSWSLASGRHTIGRSSANAVAVADPTLGPVQALLTVHEAQGLAGGGVRVLDLGGPNAVAAAGGGCSEAMVVRVGASTFSIGPGGAGRAMVLRPDGRHHVLVHRPPRPAPPNAPGPPVAAPRREAPPEATTELNVAAVVIPLLLAAALVGVMRDARFALFAVLGPALAVANWRSGRRRQRRRGAAAAARWAEALARFRAELDASAAAARANLEHELPSLAELVRTAMTPESRMWERRSGAAGWLQVNVGQGPVRVEVTVDSAIVMDAEVRAVMTAATTLADAPVGVDLATGVGVVGPGGAALASALLLATVVSHGPADLAVVALVAPERVAAWEWLKWLPHLRGSDGSPRLASTRAAARQLVEQLASEPGAPAVLTVVDDPESVAHDVRLLADLSSGSGGTLVVAGQHERLPAGCATTIEVDRLGAAWLQQPGEPAPVPVRAALATADLAVTVARRLTRYRDPDAGGGVGVVPPAVGLLDVLALSPDPEVAARQVAQRWRGSDGAPRVAIGQSAGAPLELDLVRDGPHVLVGGTTGSGKSELLRSLVAGLAAGCSPEDLVFVLIDYKGGSAFDQCAQLPHTVGLVTDLDDHLCARALVSLQAELHHREAQLRAAGCTDLAQYRAAAPGGDPLPRLVVVVDEFATLAAELPDFLGALVGVAQRGRSLGVHLVLATQRPQGAVSANIRANTNLRVALRVQSAADSTDVVDAPVAAGLSRTAPGRAYVRLGAGELQLVQTAYSGRPARRAGHQSNPVLPFTLAPPAAPACVSPSGADGGATELAVVVEAVRRCGASRHLPLPRRPWLAMLPAEIDLELDPDASGRPDPAGAALVAAFGRADDPLGQCQRSWGWRAANGNLALLGAVGSGTSTALASLVLAAAARHSPAGLHVYVVDLGGELAALAGLAQVGAVVGASEQERQLRLLERLWSEVVRRRELDPHQRATEPLVMLVVDGLAGWLAELATLEGVDAPEQLRRILTEGVAVGVMAAVAADRPGALPARLAGAFGQRVLFRLADPLDYVAAGLRPKELPVFVPGRAIDLGTRLVVQVARPARSLTAAVEAVAASIRTAVGPAEPRRPPAISVMPAAVGRSVLPAPGVDERGWRLPVGVRDGDLNPAELHVAHGDHVFLAGAARAGVSAALILLAEQFRRADPEVVIVGLDASASSALLEHPGLDAAGTSAELERVLRLAPAAARRGRRWVVIVDNASRLDAPLGLRCLVDTPGVTLVAGGRADDVRSAFGHWTLALRRSRTGALLVPRLELDGELLGVRLPRRLPLTMPAGRGFVVNGGEARLAQLCLVDMFQ